MFGTVTRTLTKLIPLGYRLGRCKPPTNRKLASIIPTTVAALLVVAAVSGSTPDGTVRNDAGTSAPPASSIEEGIGRLAGPDVLHVCGMRA
jgi:hypothetical protein